MLPSFSYRKDPTMSNPLAIFRKYQKILLVVFGVALMLTFTVGGIVFAVSLDDGKRRTESGRCRDRQR